MIDIGINERAQIIKEHYQALASAAGKVGGRSRSEKKRLASAANAVKARAARKQKQQESQQNDTTRNTTGT